MRSFATRVLIVIAAFTVPLVGCTGHGVPSVVEAALTRSQADRSTAIAPRPMTLSFVDGGLATFSEGAELSRRHSKSLGDVVVVRAKRFFAAYRRRAIRSIVSNGVAISLDAFPIATGGGSGTGGTGSCDASQSSCPVCGLCSGEVPDFQDGAVDCLDGMNCSIDPFGNPAGTWQYRFLDIVNATCLYDFDTGSADCNFDATNTRNGAGDPNNHLISYSYLFISGAVQMVCSAFDAGGLASGTFLDSRGAIFTFPAPYASFVKTTWTIGTPDKANTAWDLNFFSIPKVYNGYCKGAN